MTEFFAEPDDASETSKFNLEVLNDNIYISTLENRTEEDLANAIRNLYSLSDIKNDEIKSYITLNANHLYLTGYMDAIKSILVSIRKSFVTNKDIPDHLVLAKVIEIIKETGDRLAKNTTK